MKKIRIAYEDRQHPIEMDISKRSVHEIEKVKKVLRMIGRTWKIKDCN